MSIPERAPRQVRKPTRAESEARLTPLHYAILSRLPEAGAKWGWEELALKVRHLCAELNASAPPGTPPLTSAKVQIELRNLASIGLTIKVDNLKGNTLGWQRTVRGAEIAKANSAPAEASSSDDEMPTTTEVTTNTNDRQA